MQAGEAADEPLLSPPSTVLPPLCRTTRRLLTREVIGRSGVYAKHGKTRCAYERAMEPARLSFWSALCS